MQASITRKATLLDAFITIGFLMVMLALSVVLFGEDSSSGANQIALLFSSTIALLIGFKNQYTWSELNTAIAQGVANVFGSVLIIMTVGALIGVLIISGTVPAMIYYGLQIVEPELFYFSACVLCAVAAMSIGSSWSVAGTIGVGLMGISAGLGLSPEITAGAIISGAYFGDKMSPLSDTTNLAPAVTGTDLFIHIKHMTWTTAPAIAIALVLYLLIGMSNDNLVEIDLSEKLTLIDSTFHINASLFLPLVVIFIMAIKKVPAFPALIAGIVTAIVLALTFQQNVLSAFVTEAVWQDSLLKYVKGIWLSLFSGYEATTGDSEIDQLLSRGGINSMLNTVSLILCAITFGAILDKLGILERLIANVITKAKSVGSLVFVTAVSCFSINVAAGDQYIAIVLAGRMYKLEYKKRRLRARNLSRVLEDAGTVTSVLIPWNTCGAFLAGALGVSTFAYAPYCFFNILCPVITVVYGMYNFSITPINNDDLAIVK